MASQPQSPRVLPTLLLGVATWLLLSHMAPVFVGTAPAARKMRGSIAREGFKEDFDAWRSTLSADEKELMAEQAEKVFDKKFLKTERAKQRLPEEKSKAFADVLGKFLDTEGKGSSFDSRVPDYDSLKRKIRTSDVEFKLSPMIVEMDRDAMRKYDMASHIIENCKKEGKYFPNCTPRLEKYKIQNNDTASRAEVEKLIKFMKEVADGTEDAEVKKAITEGLATIPAMGTDIEFEVSADFLNMASAWKITTDLVVENHPGSEAEKKAWAETVLPELNMEGLGMLLANYSSATYYINMLANQQKEIYKSYRYDPSLTKADVLKEIWSLIPKITGKEPSPLDEELLAELSTQPADEFGARFNGAKHPWGTADKLYKSEAIDNFGSKYLLGVYETKEEAMENFDNWNKEFKASMEKQKGEFEQYSKRENARLESDTSAKERIMATLEDARSKLYK